MIALPQSATFKTYRHSLKLLKLFMPCLFYFFLSIASCVSAQQSLALPRNNWTQIATQIENSTVCVSVHSSAEAIEAGTGVIVHQSGLILTAFHVVNRDYTRISVLTSEGIELDATLISCVPEWDIAMLEVASEKALKAIPLGRSAVCQIGEPVLTAGNMGGRGVVISGGLISSVKARLDSINESFYAKAKSVQVDRYIQIDAASNPGSSGGPVVDEKGDLLGIAFRKQLDEQSVTYVVPVDQIRALLPRLVPVGPRLIIPGLLVDDKTDSVVLSEQGNTLPAPFQRGDQIRNVGSDRVHSAIDCLAKLRELFKQSGSTSRQLRIAVLHADELRMGDIVIEAITCYPGIAGSAAVNGLNAKIYMGTFNDASSLPKTEPAESIVAPAIGVIQSFQESKLMYGVEFEGWFFIPESGHYWLVLSSDDGSNLYVHNSLVIDNDGLHTVRSRSQVLELQKGWHPIRVQHFNGYAGAFLKFDIWSDGGNRPAKPIPHVLATKLLENSK